MADTITSYILRLLIALVIGGLIGFERELHGKAAGIRTNMLMCFGACLIMIISMETARTWGTGADPGRIAAQVITGVGFLGAGTIIRSKFHITGLTTAATIWALSALGLAIGGGYLELSIAAAALIALTLTVVRFVEGHIRRRLTTHIVQLVLDRREGTVSNVLDVFRGMHITSEALEINRSAESLTATFEYTVTYGKHIMLIEKLSALGGVRDVTEL